MERYKDTPCSWTGKLYHKDDTFPQININSKITIKIPSEFFIIYFPGSYFHQETGHMKSSTEQ